MAGSTKSKAPRGRTEPRQTPGRPQLYLGPWLVRLGRDQVEVAKAAGIGKPYMSQLVSGKKDNPSAEKLLLISQELGVSVNALYRPPPTQAQIDSAARELRPDQIEMLGDIAQVLRDRR